MNTDIDHIKRRIEELSHKNDIASRLLLITLKEDLERSLIPRKPRAVAKSYLEEGRILALLPKRRGIPKLY